MKYELLMDTPDIIKDFLIYSETIKNKSEKSVEEYFHDLRTFFRYLKQNRGLVAKDLELEKIDIKDLDIELVKTVNLNDLYSFLIYCKNVRGNNTKSRARKCSTLKIYFKYLTNNKQLLNSDPAALLEAPKVRTGIPKYLTLEESKSLLDSVDGKNYERDYCILTLFLNCGLRLSELCGINISDIRDDQLKVTGKGNKQRVIHLNGACISAIQNYMAVRPMDGVQNESRDALFISAQKKRISNKTVQHIVYTFLDKSGLGDKGYSAHKLRHTAATLMYQYGNVDVRILQEVLGHENLNTTQIYTHISDKQLNAAMENNPLSSIKAKPKKTEE